MQIKDLLKKLIAHNIENGIVDDSIIEKMDLYLLVGRITEEDYKELYNMMYPTQEEVVKEDVPTILPEVEEDTPTIIPEV